MLKIRLHPRQSLPRMHLLRSPTATASATPRVQEARAQHSEPATATSELTAQTQSSSTQFKDIENAEDWLEFARNSDKLNGPVGLFAR